MSDQLQHLAEAYFHQDYDLEFDDPNDVISAFAAGEGLHAVRRLISEIDDLLGPPSSGEDYLEDLWTKKFGAAYDPVAEGLTYRTWFERVRRALLASEARSGIGDDNRSGRD